MLNSDYMTPVPFCVQRYIRETRDSFTLELTSCDTGGGIHFQPGQFNMLYLFANGEVPISVSGDPADSRRVVHTIRAYGAVTSRMQDLKKGDILGLRGPFGNPWPVGDLVNRDIILCAGGIGLAPLRPLLYTIVAQREKFGRVCLLYGERTPDDLLYRKQIEKWRGRFDLDIRVTVDSARRDWRGNVGVVTTLLADVHIDAARSSALVCGPEIMMRFAIASLTGMGLADDHIYISMERNMKCGLGLCGHCQWGPLFVCKDGPIFIYSAVKKLFHRREL